MEILKYKLLKNSKYMHPLNIWLIVINAPLYFLQTLKEKLCLLTAEANRESEGGLGTQEEEEEKGSKSTLTSVEDSLNYIIVLCHQSSQNLDQSQREVISVCVFVCLSVCVCYSHIPFMYVHLLCFFYQHMYTWQLRVYTTKWTMF